MAVSNKKFIVLTIFALPFQKLRFTVEYEFSGFTQNFIQVFIYRFQVQRLGSMRIVFKELWKEERLHMFTKGLSARLVQSAAASFSIILGYETIKRFAINEEYKHLVRW